MAEMTELRKIDVAAGKDTAAPPFAVGQSLAAPLLYRRCDPAELPFALCTELQEAPGLIGQERAVEAVQFAMRMRRKGYNVYALGPSGSGRHSAVEGLLLGKAETEQTPPDWCYVNNFADPQRPYCLQLPPGRGSGLSVAMKRLVEELRAALPAAFERDEYRARREVLDQQFKRRSEQALGALQQRAEAKNISLLRTPMGLALAPKRDGKVLTPEMFEELPVAERERIQHELEGIQNELEAIMQQVPRWEREHREALRNLNRETTGFAIAHLMEQVVEASAKDRLTAINLAARCLLDRFGAPDLAAARKAAVEEIDFTASLCDHPPDTLIAVHRKDESGSIRETFRSLRPRGGAKRWRAFSFLDVEVENEPAAPVDLATLAHGERG